MADTKAPGPDKALAKEHDQGFSGVETDPTPNENYTVAGVVAGKPTPETDQKAHLEAHASVVSSKFPDKKKK